MNDVQNALVVVDERDRIEKSLGRLRRLATLMDDQFELPLVKYRVGLDPIIGLIPGGGDWVTWVVAVYILWNAMRLGAPVRLLIQMAAYVTLDLVTGYVPGIGDIADVFVKANKRNVDMLIEYFDGTVDIDAPEVVHIPKTALEKTRSNPVARYAVGVVLILLLFILATVPVVLIWWFFTEGRG